MRFIVFLALIMGGMISVFAQEPDRFDAYAIENEGYFSKPVATPYGIVATDNLCSNIYLINQQNLSIIQSSPGCGRYYSVSPDRSKIGFKKIDADGYQNVAIIDISTGKVTEVSAKVKHCGQVSLFEGGYAYSIDEDLYVFRNNILSKYPLVDYCNITPVSPDGLMAGFTDDDAQLYVTDLSSGYRRMISSPGEMCIYPVWSPDGRKLSYQNADREIKVWNAETSETYSVGSGGNVSWSDDSKYLIYHFEQADNMEFLGSELMITSFDGTVHKALTQTSEIHEMNAFYSNGKIYFDTYNGRSIQMAHMDMANLEILSVEEVYQHLGPVPLSHFDLSGFYSKSIKSITHIENVPYVHQKYDTPDWHNGSGSCAPTTCAMALAFYNRLPKWTIDCSTPYAHQNDYGAYVADRYRYNEIYYDTYEPAYSTDAWGGYGYMWGNGSPNSMQRQYLENHYLTSNQLWSSSCTFQYELDEIDLGYVHPMCVMLTSSGHLILTRGYVNGQHTLIFNDPYGNKNTPSYPSYDGIDAYYDWPGYNNGYMNLDYNGSYGIIAWTTRARGSEPEYNDTLIDDTFHNHGFYMNNSNDGSHQRYFHDGNVGYNGHTWWTYTMATDPDIAWVSWTPNIPEAGTYNVMAYIPSNYATATGAIYRIHHAEGVTNVTIDQSLYFDEWVSLGEYQFLPGQAGYVYLGDSTGVDNEMIAYDAMNFSIIPTGVLAIMTEISCSGNADGTATAVAEFGTSPYSYLWSTGETTQTIANLGSGEYSVTVTDALSSSAIGSGIVNEPEILELYSILINPTSEGAADGIINCIPSGGVGGYSAYWPVIEEYTLVVSNLPAGSYSVTITDGNGCTVSGNYNLYDPYCDMPSGLNITNVSSSSMAFSWLENPEAISYIVQVKQNGESIWTEYISTESNYYITGLAADSLYDVQVASVCTQDTSVFSSMNQATLALSNDTLKFCKGSIFDSGGENGLYNNYEDYVVQIAPEGATRIRLVFEEFATEATYDFLSIYDGDTAQANLIGIYDGETAGDMPLPTIALSGKLSLHFLSDYSQIRNGWKAYWIADGGTCGISPETNIDGNALEWKIADFPVDFTDTDMNGFGLKDQFFQVVEKTNGEWKGNTDFGFLNEEFNDSLAWNTVVGTWDAISGTMIQTDEAEAITNSWASLVQEQGNIYLYQWDMKIAGSGANRRAGIHFFCDDPSLVQRGNSYMVYFRVDDSKCQIYKSVNDIIDIYTDDNTEVLANTWYTYRVVLNTVSGEIDVYQNNALVSSWIDPSPHTMANSVSLRTGSCIAEYDNMKVYRSRSESEVISVNELTSYIMHDNPSPVVPAGKVSSIIRDGLLHFSMESIEEYNIDKTPPSVISMVNDGLAGDIDTILVFNELSANWTVSEDTNSGIMAYWYAIGTTPGSDDVLEWQNNGLNTSVTATGFISLINNQMYYFVVKAQNNAGLFSDLTVSDGQKAVLMPSLSFFADQTEVCKGATVQFTNGSSNTNSYEWVCDGADFNDPAISDPNALFDSAGIFDVTLIGEGLGGRDTLIYSGYITVNPNPVANFTSPDTEVQIPDAIVVFINQSEDATSFYWDFGDGSYSTDQNPYHIYSDTGYYSVTLVAGNDYCGYDTVEFTDYVHVAGPVGINESVQDRMVVYPNPANSESNVIIDGTEGFYSVTCTDITGKFLFIKETEKNMDRVVFSPAEMGLSAGTYYLHLNGNEIRKVALLVVY